MTINKAQISAGLFGGIMIGALALGAITVSAHPGSNLTDEERAAKVEQKQQNRSENLQSKVDEGTITSEQKEQIQSWMDERIAEKQANREDRLTKEEFKALSDEERAALKEEKMADHEAKKAEAEAFFEGIGVEKEDLFDGEHKGKRGHKGHGARS